MSIVEKAVEKLKKPEPVDLRDGQRASAVRPLPHEDAPPDRSPGPRPVREAGAPTQRPRAYVGPSARTAPIKVEFAELSKRGLFPPKDAAPKVYDEYRRIKRPLLANISGRGQVRVENGNRIMVASAARGEGKTFTTFNLALSIALEKDFSVLIVDGDVAKRDLTQILGLDERAGLIDALADTHVNAADLVVPTDISSLSILPAGRRDSLSPELIASRKMDHVLEDLTRAYPNRIVVFDSPPLLATSEASVLADRMGQIVMVVAAENTQQHTVMAALEMLDNTKSINCVLNQARAPAKSDDYYGGYYGSGYYEPPRSSTG